MRAGGTERHRIRGLAMETFRSGHHEVQHVDAGDEQHEADQPQQGEQRRLDVVHFQQSRSTWFQTNRARAHALARALVRHQRQNDVPIELAECRGHASLRLGQAHVLLGSGDHAYPVVLRASEPGGPREHPCGKHHRPSAWLKTDRNLEWRSSPTGTTSAAARWHMLARTAHPQGKRRCGDRSRHRSYR
jgi:hypothetical protein